MDAYEQFQLKTYGNILSSEGLPFAPADIIYEARQEEAEAAYNWIMQNAEMQLMKHAE